jgi:hypothetical protein
MSTISAAIAVFAIGLPVAAAGQAIGHWINRTGARREKS